MNVQETARAASVYQEAQPLEIRVAIGQNVYPYNPDNATDRLLFGACKVCYIMPTQQGKGLEIGIETRTEIVKEC